VRFPKLVAASAIAVLTLAACGGSSATPAGAGASVAPETAAPSAAAEPTPDGAASTSPAPAGEAVDACALLTAADLTTAIGEDFEPGVLDSVGQCIWDGDTAVVLYVQDAALDFIKSTFAGGVDATVGDHAAYWNPGEGLRSLWVDLGGGRVLVLSFPKSSDLGPEDQAIARQLAEIALGRM
jgi:hypothetical protein